MNEISASNNVTVFQNEQFGSIRVIMINGEPWFVLKEICETFGETNYRRVSARLDADEKGVSQIDTPGGKQSMTTVNEPGLFSALFAMQPEKARGVSEEYIQKRQQQLKTFKRWVTHEVLPAIRKTGSYSIPKATDTQSKDRIAEAKLLNARSRASSMWLKFSDMLNTPEHKQICAAYGTQVLNGGQMVLPLPQVEKTYSAKEVGDMYGITANRVGRIANENGLKTAKYGQLVMDVAKHCQGKAVQSFRYNETGARAIGEYARKQ